jgi:hypothetical protein
MSKPVPKQKKSNENITRHVQEGTGVCFPNPPQTPPIHRSSFALDNLLSQFCSGISPPHLRSGEMSPDPTPGEASLPDPARSFDIPFIRKDSLLQTFFAPSRRFSKEDRGEPEGGSFPWALKK